MTAVLIFLGMLVSVALGALAALVVFGVFGWVSARSAARAVSTEQPASLARAAPDGAAPPGLSEPPAIFSLTSAAAASRLSGAPSRRRGCVPISPARRAPGVPAGLSRSARGG